MQVVPYGLVEAAVTEISLEFGGYEEEGLGVEWSVSDSKNSTNAA